MDAVFNDRGETLPVNVPNQGSIPGFSDTLVVETLGRCDARGVSPLPMPGLPTHLRGLVEALGEYQQAAADAAWSGDARDAVRALAAHPLVRSVDMAERLYAELADGAPRAPARRGSCPPERRISSPQRVAAVRRRTGAPRRAGRRTRPSRPA